MKRRAEKTRRPLIAPRRITVPPRALDPRSSEPVEILDAVSGPFERHIDAAPGHTHRRR